MRYLEKSSNHLFAPVAERFRFMEGQGSAYPVSTLCRVLDVSVSGYYAWKKRSLCARKREDGELTQRIVQVFTTHREVYGSPRIVAELRAQETPCAPCR